MSFFKLITLSAYKSRILWKRHWCLFIFEFLVPAALFFLIAYGRSKVKDFTQTVIDEPTYTNEISGDILLHYHFSIGDTHLLYAPTEKWTDDLIKEAQIKFQLPNDDVKGFRTEEELLNYYAVNSNGTVIAVIFNAADEKNLDYVLRIHENGITWETNKLFNNYPMYRSETGSEKYLYKDLLALQYALDLSYIELLKPKEEIPEFMFQEFPYPPHKKDDFLSNMFMTFLPLITIFSFITLCPAVLKPIVEEKQSGSKELLKMAGLKPYMLYLGWFQHAIVTYAISVLLIVFLMKVSLFGASYPPIEYCNPFLFLVFLICYCVASISFCMAFSTLFTKPSVAMVLGILFWILSYFIPAAILNEYELLSWKIKILMSLLPNMALHFGYSEMSVYEMREVGLNFSNMCKVGDGSSNDLSFATVLIMFGIQTLLYIVITLYIENINPGPYGIPKKFYYPLTCIKQCIQRRLSRPTVEFMEDPEANLSCVEEGRGLKRGVEINKLYKRYGHNMAVNGLSMDIYENQITVLLGQNGAGKTTTMSIITGMIQATSGSVRIDGMDIRTDMDKIRKEIGWCPQHNLLFSYFTVWEHLMYFSLLRGLSPAEATKINTDLLHKLDLYKKKDDLAGNLSGGMKRKLCLGLALTGKTKVLILDEPTSGMDPESRREVWNMLLKLRGTRTILITTHFMEEADVLGDWIAIMSNGNCICYGTPMYLKKKYDTGYHLSVMLKSSEDRSKEAYLTEQIKKEVPDACLKYANGNNLVYVLPTSEKHHFPELLHSLEECEFGTPPMNPIANIAVTVTTLEEVFLRTSCNSVSSSRGNDLLTAPQRESGLMMQPLLAKRWYFFLKKWKYQLFPTLVAAFIMILVAYLSNSSGGYYGNTEPEVKFNLDIYGETSVFIEGSNTSIYGNIKNFYKEVAQKQKATIFDTSSVSDAIIQKGTENIAYYKHHMIVAAMVGPKVINIMYSNNAIHGAPISLNIAMNAVVKALFGPEHSIKTVFTPLQGINTSLSPKEQSEVQVGIMWLILVPIAMLFFMGAFIVFPNKEHASQFSRLQFISGVRVHWYWISNLLFDFLIYLPTVIVLALLFTINDAFRGTAEIGTLVMIFICYGMSCLPFTYLFSFKRSASGGFALLLMAGMFIGVVPTIIVSVMEDSQDEYYEHIAKIIKFVFLALFPQFGLTYTSVKFSRQVVRNYNWMVMDVKKKMARCRVDPNPCCNTYSDTMSCAAYKSYFSNEELGIGKELPIEAFFPLIIYMVLIIFLDSVYWKKLENIYNIILKEVKRVLNRNHDIVDRISHPNYKRNITQEENSLLAESLSKDYGGKPVVRNVSFTARRGKCFGLLGVNGAGKTTTFRMLTNDVIKNDGKIRLIEEGCDKIRESESETFESNAETRTNGVGSRQHSKDAKINISGDNISESSTAKSMTEIDSEKREYYERIGYCPQFDALNFDLSAKELLSIMAQFRNFSKEESETVANDYINLLGLDKYGDKPCGEFSGGNRRKLAFALALVGCRQYILLDEPTSGVDPMSRRKIWDIIKKLKENKNISFILTSHSMEECEALCEDMAIMKEGEINVEGPIPELKQRLGSGFTLKLKLRTSKPGQPRMVSASTSMSEKRNYEVNITDIDEVDGPVANGVTYENERSSGTDEVDGKLVARSQKYEPLSSEVVLTNKDYNQRITDLKKRMDDMFQPELKDEHEGLLHYHIKEGDRRWSGLFNKVEEVKKEFGDVIEDYTVSGTSLEDVFLSVARGPNKEVKGL